MAELIDLLASLTAHRDRERLDVGLAESLMLLLQPEAVGVWRLVGEGEDWRWLQCASMQRGQVAAASDPPWIDFQELPPREAAPQRSECLNRQLQIAAPDPVDPQRTVTVFPIVDGREQPGVVEILTVQPLSADALRTVHALLRVYGNFQGLLDYSQRDTLTGLYNRKTFDESFLKTALLSTHGGQGALFDSRRQPEGVRYWLGVLDIDHFKLVNDNYGHLIGDEVLLLVARIMRHTFRFQDRLYRFGGEEFVVMMRCSVEADAVGAFERLRANVEHYAFPQVGCVTVSVGVTEVLQGDSPSAAFARADRAVYAAKLSGRNRVCSHDELVRSGAADGGAKTGDVELF